MYEIVQGFTLIIRSVYGPEIINCLSCLVYDIFLVGLVAPFKNGLERMCVSQLLGILTVSEVIVHRRSMVTALQCQPLWSHVCSVL